MNSTNIKKIAVMGMLVAILAVCSQISIPIGTVPITAQTFAIFLIAYLLTPKYALATVGAWVLAGAVGLPVFANFTSGFSVVIGPTGGYIIGFVIAAGVMSLIAGHKKFSMVRVILAACVGLPIMYCLGALQLQYSIGLESYAVAFVAGGVPFIFFEPIKIALAVVIAQMAKRRNVIDF